MEKYYNKYTLIVLLLLLFLFSCNLEIYSQNIDLVKLELKGKVKSLKSMSCLAVEKPGKITNGETTQMMSINFDMNGNQIEYNLYFPDGSLQMNSTKKYDDNGNIVKVEFIIPNTPGYICEENFNYNEKGNLIEKNSYMFDGSLNGSLNSRSTFKYDENKYDEKGNKIEENWYKPDGSILQKNKNKYNNKGYKIEENWYNSDGILSTNKIFNYDGKGNKIEENWYESDHSLKYRCTYKYDGKGNEIENNQYRTDGSIFLKINFKYDKKGNLIERMINPSNEKLNSKYTCKYDYEGNLIEENWYNSDGNLDRNNSYKYNFDENGNWIKKITFSNKIPISMIGRIIEYY